MEQNGYIVNNCQEYNLFNSKVDFPNWYPEWTKIVKSIIALGKNWCILFQCKGFPHGVIRADSEHLLKVRICFLRFWFIIMLLLSSQNLQFLTSHRHTRRTQKKLFCNRVIAPFQRKKKWFSFLSNQFNFLSNYHTKSARLMGLHATNPSIL